MWKTASTEQPRTKTRGGQPKTNASAAGRGDSSNQNQRNKARRYKETAQRKNAATPVHKPQRSNTSLLSVAQPGHPTCRDEARQSYMPQRSYTSPKGARPCGRGHSIAQLDRGTSNRDVNRVKHNRLNVYIQMGRSNAADVVCCADVSGGGDEAKETGGS